MDVDPSQSRCAIGSDSDDNAAKEALDLVRLALFSEQRRCEDINKKVLGSNTRSKFNTVLSRAQALLRKTFGMGLVELQARNYRDQDPAEGLEKLKRQKATAVGSKTYILHSSLDAAIIERAALSDERPIEELAEGVDGDDDMPRNYDSSIA